MITNSSSIRYLFWVRILGEYTNKNEYTNTKNDNRPSLQFRRLNLKANSGSFTRPLFPYSKFIPRNFLHILCFIKWSARTRKHTHTHTRKHAHVRTRTHAHVNTCTSTHASAHARTQARTLARSCPKFLLHYVLLRFYRVSGHFIPLALASTKCTHCTRTATLHAHVPSSKAIICGHVSFVGRRLRQLQLQRPG